MDWKKESINQLRDYEARKDSLENLRQRCQNLDQELKSLRRTPQGDKAEEERILSVMTERKQLMHNYWITRKTVELTQRGLDALDGEERAVLEGFYVHRGERYADDLMEQLCVERTKLYNLKDQALRKFTVTMYGMTES